MTRTGGWEASPPISHCRQTARSFLGFFMIFAFMTENTPRRFFRYPPVAPSPDLSAMPPVYRG